MHGLADQAEFDHRTIGGDEACIRRAAAGGEFGLAARDLLDRRDNKIGEGAGLGHEYIGVRRLPHDPCANAIAASFREPLLDQRFQALLVMEIIETDVEPGASLARDHIAGGVADIDRGEFEVGGLELRAAVIERLVAQRHDQPRNIRHRVRGAMRIGDVALHAVNMQRARLRAAAADLDAVAHHLDIAGLTDHAMIEFLSPCGGPFQQLDRAVDCDVFLVAGDEERNRTFTVVLRLAAIGCEIIENSGDAAGDPAFHVDGAAPIQKAVLHIARECAVFPGGFVAGRHDVGMSGKADMGRLGTDAGIEVVDIGGARLRKGDAVHVEAGSLQDVLEDAERAGIRRRHRRAANQIAGNREGVTHGRLVPSFSLPLKRGGRFALQAQTGRGSGLHKRQRLWLSPALTLPLSGGGDSKAPCVNSFCI